MSRFQLYLLPLLACVVFLLTGSMEQTAAPLLSIPGPAPASPIEPWTGETRPLPGDLEGVLAVTILDRAIAAYKQDNISWLDVSFRQQVAYDDISCRLEGRFFGGPGQRARYELKVTIPSGTSSYRVICNGDKLAEIVEMPGTEKQVSTVQLPEVKDPTDNPAAIAQARQELLDGKTFRGVNPLLSSLRTGLVEPRLQAVHRQGEELLEIRGKWVVDGKQVQSLPAELRLRAVPRECRVYFDTATLWPRCVEWWGATSPSQPAQLLVQTIYHQPSINQPPTPEQAAQAFSLASP